MENKLSSTNIGHEVFGIFGLRESVRVAALSLAVVKDAIESLDRNALIVGKLLHCALRQLLHLLKLRPVVVLFFSL